MIPDFKTYLNESVWGDIRKKSLGQETRTEDDVNHLNAVGFCDYLKEHYKTTNDRWIINYDKDGDYIVVPLFFTNAHVKVTRDIKLYLTEKCIEIYSFNGWPDDIKDLMHKKYSVMTGSRYGFSVIHIKPREGEFDNKFCLDVIDTILSMAKEPFLEKVVEESVWGDIRKKSLGQEERMEDDVNQLSCAYFYKYLLENYRGVNGYMVNDNIHLWIGNHTIVIQVYENSNRSMGGGELQFEYNEKFFVEVLGDAICITLSPDNVKNGLRSIPDWLVKELGNIADVKQYGDEKGYVIRPKDRKATNGFCCKVLDFILERMENNGEYRTKLKRK